MVKVFRSKPFPLFDAIGDLVDGTRATGEGVFHAGRQPAFDENDSPIRGNSPTSDTNIDPAIRDISNTQKASKGKGRAAGTQVSTFQAVLTMLLMYTDTHSDYETGCNILQIRRLLQQ